MKRSSLFIITIVAIATAEMQGEVPGLIGYQGRVTVGGTNFTGTGQFKFALVNSTGAISFWSNNGSSVGGSEPTAAVSLAVSNGLYSVLLGDTTIANMTESIPATVFTNADVNLRVWFDDGVNGSQQLAPDTRIAAVGYALNAQMAETAATILSSADVTAERLNIGVGHVLTGTLATIAGGTNNVASGNYSSIGGGFQNQAAGSSAAVGGGTFNSASATGSTVAGGQGNQATNSNATAGGGQGNVAGGGDSTIAGGAVNMATGLQSAIGGGRQNSATGQASTVGGGDFNRAFGEYSTVSGGRSQRADGDYATIAGGWSHRANSDMATISGGVRNNAAAVAATIGGGEGNTNTQAHATIGGGVLNLASGTAATIGGGTNNTAGADGTTVGGGRSNNASGFNSTVGGGVSNDASGDESTVAGGENNTASGENSFVGGGIDNIASASEATVAGGAENLATNVFSTVSGGQSNHAEGQYSAVAGGVLNVASGDAASIGGGSNNIASGIYSVVAGGFDNTASGERSMIGGGYTNLASGYAATIGGGSAHEASGQQATVAGGAANMATALAATVGGGNLNTASGARSVVGGGTQNAATNESSTVPGGSQNLAGGQYSFAAGRRAKAMHQGSFVWADSTAADFSSTANNQLLIRAQGGVGIGTPSPEGDLHIFRGSAGSVSPPADAALVIENDAGAYIHIQTPTGVVSGVMFGTPENSLDASIRYNNSGDRDLTFRAGGNQQHMIICGSNGFIGIGTSNPTNKLHVVGNIFATGVIFESDQKKKHGFERIEPSRILEQVASLSITEWTHQEEEGVRHLGPMAQDFHAAFGLGKSDTAISVVDAHGVALAAIQGLYEELKEERAKRQAASEEIGELRKEIENLKRHVAASVTPASGTHP